MRHQLLWVTTFAIIGLVRCGDTGEEIDTKVISMVCERRCLEDCKLKFNSSWEVTTESTQVDVPNDTCYDKNSLESMTEEDRQKCEDSKDQANMNKACHTRLMTGDKHDKEIKSNLVTQISCHLTNNQDAKKYYSSVSGKIVSEKENCNIECHTKCDLCWSADDCVPVCQADKEYQIEEFSPVECARPFYFCSAQLSVNKITLGNTAMTKPFLVGTCKIDPSLPVFLSIAILLIFMFIAYTCRNKIRSCLDR